MTVVDIKMPFGSMVAFMIKWAIASIPALVILWIIGTAIVTALGGRLSGDGSAFR